ncbi:ABC transporter permease [Desulfovibrio inopinatus]|uniref:ABC transporter permease n=1 Tax=Desulfovibrio inopinatus TaxID=102109 RepID=UPI00040158CF|nr:MlaE family lipid ABC transporter permease subunit [Desulfovibrio inopinatus]
MTPPSSENARFEVEDTRNQRMIICSGEWTVNHIAALDSELRAFAQSTTTPARFLLEHVERMDTAGAWMLYRTVNSLRQKGNQADFENVHPDYQLLLDQVSAHAEESPPPKSRLPFPLDFFLTIGEYMSGIFAQARDLLGFLGLFLTVFAKALIRPTRFRLTALVNQMEQVGFNAVPIAALISFLIGVVLAYMGAQQLAHFGAQVFVVNLIEVAVLRELGILLTAIIVAGRSGSAFTAQIGSMVVNEEVDAMRAMGLDPMEILVIPRITALLIMMPLLGFLADLMGLFGGGLMCWTVLDIGPGAYLTRLHDAVKFWDVVTGLIKAPFFAIAIGLIGCHCGFSVTGSAESVGRLTTSSVVQAIFIVIVMDALFAVFFSSIGI